MKPTDDDVTDCLVGSLRAAGDCPDENLLAGWAESRLDAGEATRVEAHLSRCDACREAACALRGDPPAPAGSAAPTSRRPWLLRLLAPRVLVAAAVVLVMLLAGLSSKFLRRDDAASSDPVEVARALRAAHPGVLDDLVPHTRAELDAAPSALRGGLVIVDLPARLLAPPARFAWRAVPGAAGYKVRLRDADGAVLVSRDVAATEIVLDEGPSPLVAGGRYVLEVEAAGALGRAEARAAFAIATAAEVEAFDRARRALASSGTPAPDLWVAELALRRGLVLEAEQLAAARVAAQPDDAHARALLAHARRLLSRE